MRKRTLLIPALVLLAILVTLIVWQQSFTLGEYAPANPDQTFVFWAVSTLIFLLTVTIGFMLFRTFVKLYLERQRNREGSRLQTKLVLGALGLSVLPVIFLVAFSYDILNRNVEKWFMRPVEGIRIDLQSASAGFSDEVAGRAQALANWLAAAPELRAEGSAAGLCAKYRIAEVRLEDSGGVGRRLCAAASAGGAVYSARAPIEESGTLVVRVQPHTDVVAGQSRIDEFVREYNSLSANKRSIRTSYLQFIALIALFILFVATWMALTLSRQISGPIAALLDAAGEVRKGNLAHRVSVPAIDEMASLVRGFNEMTQGLETSRDEIESRRQFTEAILESIPTGVISLSSDGRIQRVNRALRALVPAGELARATTIADLLPPEHTSEIRYLMKRARRMGVAGTQLEIERGGQMMHLAVTVSALPAQGPDAPGYVVVVEDTSEVLRAQKAAAWHEVARRIAHELKNPLTPIALSAERIARQLARGAQTPEAEAVLRQCAATISREVESVKALADEFSQFSRFPAAQLSPCDLNQVVRHGLDVFDGRLEGIGVELDLGEGLPSVMIDPEQFQRVVVNLVDNAAEAMRESMVKRLLVATRATSADTVELLVADTGQGVSAEDREKLFLPYFSTKGRGTGLGLAIVSHIVAEHNARIRVEDNRPVGACFYVEIPLAAPEAASESAAAAAGVRA
jgi:PAS domain S-box-containing protein